MCEGPRARRDGFSRLDVPIASRGMRPDRQGQTRPFPFEELALRLGAALRGVVPESAGLRDHSMARNHNDRRVPRAGGPDRAARSRSPEAACDLPVRDRLAGRNRPQEVEDLPFERRDLEVDGNVPQIPVPGVDMFEDPGQIRMVRSRNLSGSLASQPHRRDAIPQDLELDVEAKFTTELRVDLQRLPVFSAGTHADHWEHRPDDMMLGPVQVLLEGAASEA